MKEDGYRRKGVLQDERGWLVVTGAKVIYMMKEGGCWSKGDLQDERVWLQEQRGFTG